jgi:UrcA family protein
VALDSSALAAIVALMDARPSWSADQNVAAVPRPANYAISKCEAESLKVKFADLDLSKHEGAKTLYRRIQWAARWACGTEPFLDPGLQYMQYMWQQCYNHAVADAVAKVNNPLLTAEYNIAIRGAGPPW